jgi:Ala-tRNA(Pro) deacylase
MNTSPWVKQELDKQGCTYEERHHAEAFTAQALAEREHISGHRVAKVVIAMADGKPVELVLPASRRVDLDRVCALLGANQVRLATEEEMERCFADCDTGAVPALRHWQGVDVLMDESLRVDGDIMFQGETHRDAFCMGFADWFALVNPRVERFSKPRGGREE